MKKESSAGAVIFFKKGKKIEYLLLNYPGGHWDFPKGHIELHENPIKTAIREIKEETGLDVKIIRGFERKITYSFKDRGENVIKDVIFYLAQAKTQTVRLSEEHKGYVWLPYEKAYELITFNKSILRDAERFLKRTLSQSKHGTRQVRSRSNGPGFTLIEILVVLSMILILFSITAQIFKPTVYFQRTRDNKRIGDLKSLEIALRTYLLATTTPILGPVNQGVEEASSTIFISIPWDKEDLRNRTIVWNNKTYYFSQVSSTEVFKNNGRGWLPVNLSVLPYPPLFALPGDPLNSFNMKYFYSYVFKRASSTFEINANLETQFYQSETTDNGDNANVLEVGNDKSLMPNNLY